MDEEKLKKFVFYIERNMQVKLSSKKDNLETTPNINFNQSKLNNNPPLARNLPQPGINNIPQMPKPFNQTKNFSNQKPLQNNNPFNKRGL